MSEQATVRRIQFNPLPAQKRFLESTHPEIVYSGGFGSGKTRVLCEKAHFLSMHYPGNRGLLARKYNADLAHTTLATLLQETIPTDHILEHNKSEQRILVKSREPGNPSEILYCGLDRESKIASMNLGFSGVDEMIDPERPSADVTESEWTMLQGRMRLNEVPFHQVFGVTNPGHPAHWVHDRFKTNATERQCLVQASTRENMANLPESYLDRLENLTGSAKKRYLLGEWVGQEGLIYPEYDPTKHLIPRFDVPSDWARYRVVDWGTANPFVCQWWTQDPQDATLIMYQEAYKTGRTAKQHAGTVRDYTEHEDMVQFTVADHDPGDARVWHNMGLETQAAIKDVQEGIQIVRSGGQTKKNAAGTTHGLTGQTLPHPPDEPETWPPGCYADTTEEGDRVVRRPGLLFMRDTLIEHDQALENQDKPTDTVEEFPRYKWAEGAHDTVKEEPLKKNDHGMDCLRYLAMHLEYRHTRRDAGEVFTLGGHL